MPDVESRKRLPPSKSPVLQRRAQDVEGRAVFDRAAGVEPLGLGVDLHIRRKPLSDALQGQQRGVAHGGFQAGGTLFRLGDDFIQHYILLQNKKTANR